MPNLIAMLFAFAFFFGCNDYIEPLPDVVHPPPAPVVEEDADTPQITVAASAPSGMASTGSEHIPQQQTTEMIEIDTVGTDCPLIMLFAVGVDPANIPCVEGKQEICGNTTHICGTPPEGVYGDVSNMSGDISDLTPGDYTGVEGDMTGRTGPRP